MADGENPEKALEQSIRSALAQAREAKGPLKERWVKADTQITEDIEFLNAKLKREGETELTDAQKLEMRNAREAETEAAIINEIKAAKKKGETNANRFDFRGMWESLKTGDFLGVITQIPFVGSLIEAAVNYFFNNPKDSDHPNGKSFSEVRTETGRQKLAGEMAEAAKTLPISEEGYTAILEDAARRSTASAPATPTASPSVDPTPAPIVADPISEGKFASLKQSVEDEAEQIKQLREKNGIKEKGILATYATAAKIAGLHKLDGDDGLSDKEMALVKVAAKTTLRVAGQTTSPSDADLIKLVRSANDEGKKAIFDTARQIAGDTGFVSGITDTDSVEANASYLAGIKKAVDAIRK